MRTQTAPGLRPASAAALLTGAARLRVALQPIVHARNGRVLGLEALLRGQEALGCATPPALLDLAATLGCLPALEAALQAEGVRAFAAVAPGDATLYLNLDGRSIAAGGVDVLRPMLDAAAQAGVAPGRICIELGEAHRGLMPAATGMALRALGLKVALDDLGSGFSEIRSLAAGGVDVVKLDRWLLRDAPDFLPHLVRFLHGLGAQVVAEGVETAADCAACQAARVDMMQGWFFARAEPDHALLKPRYPVMAAARA